MQCLPLTRLTVASPGTPAPITSTVIAAALTIQAEHAMTGTLLVRDTASGATLAELQAGETWATPPGATGILPAAFSVDAKPGATNAAAIVTAWIR